MTTLLKYPVACIFSLVAASAWPADIRTDAEVWYLLDHVRNTDMVFIRNGKEHGPQDAYEHMQRKAKHFEKKIDTAEDFIEYAATKSTMSGRKYQVRLAGGQEQFAADYLLQVLAEFRAGLN